MLDKESVRRAARYLQQQTPRQTRERPLYFEGGVAVGETATTEVRAVAIVRARYRLPTAA